MVIIPGLIVLFFVLLILWLSLGRLFKPIGNYIVTYLNSIFKNKN